MKKRLSVRIFREIAGNETKAERVLRYPCGGRELELAVRPCLTLAEKRAFAEAVWSIYYAPDAAGTYDFRPYALEPAIRLMTLYFHCPTLKIDPARDLAYYHDFLMETGVYDAVRDVLGMAHEELREEVRRYVAHRVDERRAMLQLAAKSELDGLLHGVLERAQALLDRMADGELDPARALHAAIRLQQLAEDGTLAENLLQLREKRPQAEPAEPRGAQAAN